MAFYMRTVEGKVYQISVLYICVDWVEGVHRLEGTLQAVIV